MSTEICKLAADAGKCSNSLMRYYYDPTLRDCRQFVYGGCHGNANRFLTYADCETTCKQLPQTAVDGTDVEGIVVRPFMYNSTPRNRVAKY